MSNLEEEKAYKMETLQYIDVSTYIDNFLLIYYCGIFNYKFCSLILFVLFLRLSENDIISIMIYIYVYIIIDILRKIT